MQCEIFQATLLGNLPQDEDLPPGDDDDDNNGINPNNFAFFGFRQPGQGPLEASAPHFNPFAAPNPNHQNLQAMGWDFWPNQQFPAQADGPVVEIQPELEHVLDLIPLQPVVQEQMEDNDPKQLAIPEEMVVNAVEPKEEIHIADDAQVLVVDDLTDASDNEPEPALLPIEPVEIVPFPNFDNLQPLMPYEVQPEDFLDFLDNPVEHQDPIHHKNLNVGFV